MVISGIVFEQVDSQIATIETEVQGQYLFCSVIVNSSEVIKFPLAANADLNEVALRVGNVINQTGLVSNVVRIETSEI